MSKAMSGGVSSAKDNDFVTGREQAERKTEEQAARWAQALLPHLGPQPLPAPPPSPTPEGWRPSDGALTRAHASAASAPDLVAPQSDAEGANGERVVVSVKTPELGDLSLVLERSEAGVRVVIGVADASKLGQMANERAALLHQLERAGVDVQRIDVVRQGDVGTVLAQHKFVERLRASRMADPVSSEEQQKQRRRGSRKLDFTG